MENLSGIKWGGVVETRDLGVYIENYLLLIMGGIPWQVSAVFLLLKTYQSIKAVVFLSFFINRQSTGLFSTSVGFRNFGTSANYVVRCWIRITHFGSCTSFIWNYRKRHRSRPYISLK